MYLGVLLMIHVIAFIHYLTLTGQFNTGSTWFYKINFCSTQNEEKSLCIVLLLFFKVKEQHYQRNVEFLADQLKVVDRQEAKNRIFFVSAKETLISRLHEDNKTPTPRKFHYQLN